MRGLAVFFILDCMSDCDCDCILDCDCDCVSDCECDCISDCECESDWTDTTTSLSESDGLVGGGGGVGDMADFLFLHFGMMTWDIRQQQTGRLTGRKLEL